jgi:phage host-nuclease inhibitor protein Gam
MTRKRIDPPKLLGGWDEVDGALRRIGDLQREIELEEAAMQESIDKAKNDAADRAKPAKDEITKLEAQLSLFADLHRDDLGKKKSRELNHGVVGYRKSTKAVLPRGESKLLEIIRRLREKGMTDCIISPSPKIDKDALKKYPPNDVVEVGASLEVTDTFWYEVTRDELQQ